MKTTRLKSVLYSLLAIMALAAFMTSCEQQELVTTEIETPIELTQEERERAIAEADLIMSYGEEVVEAYNAYMSGEILGYYSPLGVTETVDFDWSKYAEIMEHTKIMKVLAKSGTIDLYTGSLPVGTYVTMQQMEEITPELVQYIDNPDEITVALRGCDTIVSTDPWYSCSGCWPKVMCVGCCGGGCITIAVVRNWCRQVVTECYCYTEKRTGGC